MREEERRISNFAITGRRGIGKSTTLQRILERVTWLRIARFATVRVEEQGQHVGYALQDPYGGQEVFAHREWAGPVRIGRWGYEPAVFDRAARKLQRALGDYDALAFDEIGFMEDEAPEFRRALRAWLQSDKPVLLVLKENPNAGTVHWVLRTSVVRVWRIPDFPPQGVVKEILRLLRQYPGRAE